MSHHLTEIHFRISDLDNTYDYASDSAADTALEYFDKTQLLRSLMNDEHNYFDRFYTRGYLFLFSHTTMTWSLQGHDSQRSRTSRGHVCLSLFYHQL